MSRIQTNFIVKILFAILLSSFLFVNSSSALELELEPSIAVRGIGQKIRVKIYVNNADSLISMGVRVSFNPSVFQVVAADKNTDFDQGWLMDVDGNPGTGNDQYTLPAVTIDNQVGNVTMIGGRSIGGTTQSLSGRVLLGWIDFNAIAIGISSLNVDLAKYHPQHPDQTFDNFVKVGGSVDEPTNIGTDLGKICVADNPCPSDFNVDGVVDEMDRSKFGEDWRRTDCNAPLLENCECDLNGDGRCDMNDWLKFSEDWGRIDCPTCE